MLGPSEEPIQRYESSHPGAAAGGGPGEEEQRPAGPKQADAKEEEAADSKQGSVEGTNSPTPSGPNPPTRNWMKTWGVTLGIVAAGWGIVKLTKTPSKAELDPAAATASLEPGEIAFPDAKFFDRFGEEGDLENRAYQFVEDGLFSYEFPMRPEAASAEATETASSSEATNTSDSSEKEAKPAEQNAAAAEQESNPKPTPESASADIDLSAASFVAIRGLMPGEENNSVIEQLRNLGVAIRDGESLDKLRTDAANEKRMEQEQAIAAKEATYGFFRTVLIWGIVLGGIGYLISRAQKRSGGGLSLNPLANSDAGQVLTERPKEGFDHIGGIQQVVSEMRYLQEDVQLKTNGDPNIELPKGILLYGPPGTGKTMLARALAAETSCPYVSFKGSELSTQFFVGSGVASVKQAFAKARDLRDKETERLQKEEGNPHAEGVCILFIDEFDSLAQRRNDGRIPGGGDKEETKVVNTLLAEMDNISKELNRNIIVIAATNSLDALDPAAIRPGRFNRRIEVPQPESKRSRLDILTKATKFKLAKRGYSIAEPEKLDQLASMTPGKSGAALVGILEKAAAIALRSRRKEITYEDLMEGMLQEDVGYRSDREIPREEQEKTGVHEIVGHALVAHYCGIACRLITMRPRGKTLGMVIPDPDSMSEFAPTKSEILKQVLLAVAGSAAEGHKYGEAGRTLGNSQDMRQARGMIRQLISNGLIGDSLAQSLVERDPRTEELSDEHREILDKGLGHALKTVSEILQVLPNDLLDKMVDEALASNAELIGDEAEDFLKRHLRDGVDGKKQAEIGQLIDGFISNPLNDHRQDRGHKSAD